MFPQYLKRPFFAVLGTSFILLCVSPKVDSIIRVPRQKESLKRLQHENHGRDGDFDLDNDDVGIKVRRQTVDGGDGEEATTKAATTVQVETATSVPVVDIKDPNFSFLTQHGSSNYYISAQAEDKDGALNGCRNIKDSTTTFDLAALNEKDGEFSAVKQALLKAGIDEVYINAVVRKEGDGEVYVFSSLYGEKQVDARNIREKRSSLLSGDAGRRVKRAGEHFITVLETSFPWVKDWENKPQPSCQQNQCEPTVCTVTTPDCTAVTQNCTVGSGGNCTVLKTESCSMVCELCTISHPDCYVREPKCTIVKERTCTVSDPECTIITPNCTVERPSCVSRQPPCNVTQNTSPNCTTPVECLEGQGMNCTTMKLDCTPEELATNPAACEYEQCEPLPICILPDYCRLDQVICPPIVTYCPPEIVKCLPPSISCGEPEITCVPASYYCPPPEVVCSKPLVNCSAPVINCPNVLTTCTNPDVQCPPPEVTCPPPSVKCIPPENPCPVHKIPSKPCLKECNEDCDCIKLKKDGNDYKYGRCKCTEKFRYICEGSSHNPRPAQNPRSIAPPDTSVVQPAIGKSLTGIKPHAPANGKPAAQASGARKSG